MEGRQRRPTTGRDHNWGLLPADRPNCARCSGAHRGAPGGRRGRRDDSASAPVRAAKRSQYRWHRRRGRRPGGNESWSSERTSRPSPRAPGRRTSPGPLRSYFSMCTAGTPAASARQRRATAPTPPPTARARPSVDQVPARGQPQALVVHGIALRAVTPPSGRPTPPAPPGRRPPPHLLLVSSGMADLAGDEADAPAAWHPVDGVDPLGHVEHGQVKDAVQSLHAGEVVSAPGVAAAHRVGAPAPTAPRHRRGPAAGRRSGAGTARAPGCERRPAAGAGG